MSHYPSSVLLKELLNCLHDNRGDLLEYDAEQQLLVPYPWYVMLLFGYF